MFDGYGDIYLKGRTSCKRHKKGTSLGIFFQRASATNFFQNFWDMFVYMLTDKQHSLCYKMAAGYGEISRFRCGLAAGVAN